MADRGQGYKYQLSVTAYLASLLSKDKTVQDYRIFYEVQEVAPFDDIVLAVQYNDSEDFHMYFVQVKSGKVKLDVNTYLDAYNRITENKHWECFKSQVSECSEDDIQFWYFACKKFPPQPIPFQEGKQLELRKRTINDEKLIVNKENVYELFSEDEVITRKCQDFFKDFYVFVDQPNTNKIICSLKRMWALNDTSPIIDYLDKYFTQNKRESLRKADFEHELLRIRLWDSIVKPTKIVQYQKEFSLAWNDLTLSYNVTIVKNELDIETCLFACILRNIEEKITIEHWNACVSNEGKLSKEMKDGFTSKSDKPETLKDLLVYYWRSGKIPLVLKGNSSLPQLKDFLNLNQHYIIIDSDPDRRYDEMESYSLTAIKDLRNARAKQLLQSVIVSMQGRRPTCLYEIINGDKRLMQTLTCLDVLKLMEPRQVYLSKDCLEAHNYTLFIIETTRPEPTDYEEDEPDGDSFCIYCHFDQSCEIYEKVKRHVGFQNYKIYRLRLENDKLKLIRQFDENKIDEDFQGLESFQIDQYGNNVYSINGNDAVPIIGEVTRMSCWKYLQRYMRNGIINREKYGETIIKFSETVFPDSDFFKETDGKVCVITGEAGIGKTTFLQALIQNCAPQYYVQFYNLTQFQVDMQNNFRRLLKDPLSFLWSKQGSLLYDHFFFILRKDRKRIILLLDSFDEVISTCKEQVLELIRKLNEESCIEKIFIGSRLLTVELLADQFATIKITKIEQFSNEYNDHYLENWNLDQDSVQEVPAEFATNPLYLDMLRKISQNSEINFQALSKWTLYNRIVESEIERYSRRIKHLLDDLEKKHMLRFHWGLALKLIVGNNHVTQKFVQESQVKFTNAARLGLIKYYDENEDPVFIHHTFAEFFAAQWLIATNDKEDAKFIYKLMLENRFHNILDIHSEQYPLHKAVLNADKGVEISEQIEKLYAENKEVLIQIDGIGRTALHLAASSYSHNIHMCLETIIRYMHDEGYDLYSRDHLLNWTWIDYWVYTSESCITEVSSKFCAIYKAYWHYYASSRSMKHLSKYIVFDSYQIAVNHFLPSILIDLLLVRYFDNEDFIRFHHLCLRSDVIVGKLPKYFELDELQLKPLHLAVIYSNINVVRGCIRRGDKIRVVDRFGCTPLYYSVLKQNSEIIQLLLKPDGGQLKQKKDSIFSIFQLSLQMRNGDITMMLIKAIDFKRFGSDWLYDAIDFGDTQVVAMLLRTKIDPNIERNDYEHERFLSEIRCRDALKALKKCHQYNYDVCSMPLDDYLSFADALRNLSQEDTLVTHSALNRAIHTRSNDIVHLLLKKGVNINTKILCFEHVHIYESSPLSCAVRSWNIGTVELLLEYGANVNYVESNGLTSLITAIREDVVMYEKDGYRNCTDMSDMFKKRLYNEHRIDITRVISKLALSLNESAFLERRLQIVAVLLKYGADVNFKVGKGLLPLEEALNTRNWMLVEMLLLHGANPNDLNQWNFTDILAVLPTENINIIELLVKNGVNPNFNTACDVTPLYVAARRRQADMVRLLLEYGANANIITCTHKLLAKAKENGEIDAVTLLLNLSEMCFVGPIYDPIYPIEVLNFLQTVTDQGAINFANEINVICDNDNVDLINKLLRYAADLGNPNGMKYVNVVLELRKPKIDQILLENFGDFHKYQSAVVYAAKHSNKAMIEILTRNGKGVNSMSSSEGTTALISAIKSSMDRSVVKFLLENQADVNLVDKYGKTALHWAIERQNIDIIEILLKYKATVDYVQENGFTSLSDAICKNNKELVQIIVDIGADVNFVDECGLTPLYTAIMKGNTDIIRILLRYGAKSNIETCGNTLLYKAIQSRRTNIVELLLRGKYSPNLGNYEVIQSIYRNPAKVNTVYEFGLTPLHLATKARHYAIVQILLHFNADSNQVDEHGRTALHYAAELCKIGIVRELLNRNANANIKDKNGLTPLDYAKIRGQPNIIRLLSSN